MTTPRIQITSEIRQATRELVKLLNTQLGTSYTDVDALFFEAVIVHAFKDEKLVEAAAVGSRAAFAETLGAELPRLMREVIDAQQAIFNRYICDDAFGHELRKNLSAAVYVAAR